MASGVREERCALSAHCSSEAAAITDLSEQPETPGPQPRQGAKAAVVPVMENAEFSSKLPGFRLPVLAWVVESGRALSDVDADADALSDAADAALEGCSLEEDVPEHAVNRLHSSTAHSARAKGRIYFNFISRSSVGLAPAVGRSYRNDTP